MIIISSVMKSNVFPDMFLVEI